MRNHSCVATRWCVAYDLRRRGATPIRFVVSKGDCVTEGTDKPAHSRSGVARVVGGLVALCAHLLYALVGLGMRLLMARVFFLSGQGMIEGPTVPFWTFGGIPNFSMILPVELKDAALQAFTAQYAALPIEPTTAAYLFAYAQFVFPICLAIGFATRFAALGLFALTMLTSFYVMPEAFWSTHAYWMLILLALVSVGPGGISIDAVIRYLNRP
jgi:putative oxidoreductase